MLLIGRSQYVCEICEWFIYLTLKYTEFSMKGNRDWKKWYSISEWTFEILELFKTVVKMFKSCLKILLVKNLILFNLEYNAINIV